MDKKKQTARGKRILDNKGPLVHENDKTTLMLFGRKTTETIRSVFKDLIRLKKPLVKVYTKANSIDPWASTEDIEKFCTKEDCSLFIFGSDTKRNHDNLTIGRLFDSQVLDMYSFKINEFTSMDEVLASLSSTNRPIAGLKPFIIFQGDRFDTDLPLKSLLIDLFRGKKDEQVMLVPSGMTAIVISASGDQLVISTMVLLLDGDKVEAKPCGPMIELTVNEQRKIHDPERMKTALKRPREVSISHSNHQDTGRLQKNVGKDVLGNVMGKLAKLDFSLS